jgi:endonuclease/exonuclease/phosphatase family metal-dependent hydrolase
MSKRISAARIVGRRFPVLIAACFPALAHAANVRVVTYNLQADTGISNSVLLPNVTTVLEGVGQQQYTGDGILELPDIIALQETTSNSTTVAPIVSALNSYYSHPGLYNYSSYQATTSDGTTGGGGPNALIYNQTTLNLLASVGVGTPESATNGMFRQEVRYEFQPVYDAGTSNGIFYVYDGHLKSGSASESDDGTTDGAMREGEAQIIRNDEAANLPSTAAVLYVGDYNGDGSTEAFYQTMTAAASPSGVTQGAGIDPLNPTDNYDITWGSSTLNQLSEADDRLEYRDDLQFMTANIYNGSANTLSYVPGSLHAFGNNGTIGYEDNINSSSNSAVNDIMGHGSLTPATVLGAMNKSTGSDHLPVAADYTIAGFGNGIWTGGTGNWSNFTYWTNETVPNSSTLAVEIANGNPIASVLTLNQNATIASLVLDANDTLNINTGQTLNLAGPAITTFNGILNNSGTISGESISIAATGVFTSAAGSTLDVSNSFTNQRIAVFSGSQNWSAGAVFNNNGVTATFNTDAGSSGATLSVNNIAGTIIFASTQHLASLNISNGALVELTSSSSRTVLVTASLTDAGTLNITDNALDISGGNLMAITALVQQGYNASGGGYWNGTGINSSTAAGDTTHLTAVGVIQNNQGGSALFTASNLFEGIIPGAGDVLVKYTYYGDANLDGQVDASDYSLIDNGFLNSLTGWYNGDFNYDGVIDGSDYTLIDNAFNMQGAQLNSQIAASTEQFGAPAADFGEISRAVPEPGMGAVMGIVAISGLRRRRNLAKMA